jgi:hypothetical protein
MRSFDLSVSAAHFNGSMPSNGQYLNYSVINDDLELQPARKTNSFHTHLWDLIPRDRNEAHYMACLYTCQGVAVIFVIAQGNAHVLDILSGMGQLLWTRINNDE